MKVSELKTRVDETTDLATLPGATAELMSILQSNSIPLDYIAAIIQTDPALTAKILRAANSPHFENAEEIETIDGALQRLGENEMRNALFHFTVFSKSANFTPEQEQWMHQFWIHSVACAFVAKMLADRFGIQTTSKEFIAGILHDIGKLFLVEFLPKESARLQHSIVQTAMNDTDAEIKLFGATHAAVGEWLAERWNLPVAFRRSIAFHHDPRRAGDHKILAALINFAEACCVKLGYGFLERTSPLPIDHSKGWAVLEESYPGLRTMDETTLLTELRAGLKNQTGFTTLAQSSYLFTQMVADHNKKMEDIKTRVDALDDLAAIPRFVTDLLSYIDKPDLSTQQISVLVEREADLSSRMLHVVNSPFYDFPDKIHTPQQAAAFLGLREFNNILLGIAFVRKLYSEKSWIVRNLDEYWEHAIACGMVARIIASKLSLPTGGVEFSAAILHDLGKLILLENFPEQSVKIAERMQKEQCSDIQAEMAILGVSHTEIGGWIADRWNVPDSYLEVIRYHQMPSQARRHPILVSTVRLADAVVQMNGIGLYEGPVCTSLASDEGWQTLIKTYPFAGDIDPDRMAAEIQCSVDDVRGFLVSATSDEVRYG